MAVLLHHGYSLTISPVKPSREKNGSEETAVSESRKDSGKNPQDFCTSQSWDAQEHFCSRTSNQFRPNVKPRISSFTRGLFNWGGTILVANDHYWEGSPVVPDLLSHQPTIHQSAKTSSPSSRLHAVTGTVWNLQSLSRKRTSQQDL